MNVEYTNSIPLHFDQLWKSWQVGSGRYDLDESMNIHRRRDEMVKKYSWAIPTDTVLERIAQYSPLVEMGAGTGYWAYELQRRGAKVFPFDLYPPTGEDWTEEEERRAHGSDWHPEKSWYHRGAAQWTHVVKGTPEVLKRFDAKYNLLLCWPPMDDMAMESLGYHRGKYIIYIGEGEGGCTANRKFFRLLDRFYDEVETMSIPQWPGIHDYVHVYKHRSR